MAFPKDHWNQLHSTNPLERLNKEIKRRTNITPSTSRECSNLFLSAAADPSTQRRLEKLTGASGNSFRAVAEEVLVKLEREGRADVTLAKKRWLLDFAYPAIGERPVAEITAPEVLAVLRKVEARGRYETARGGVVFGGLIFEF